MIRPVSEIRLHQKSDHEPIRLYDQIELGTSHEWLLVLTLYWIGQSTEINFRLVSIVNDFIPKQEFQRLDVTLNVRKIVWLFLREKYTSWFQDELWPYKVFPNGTKNVREVSLSNLHLRTGNPDSNRIIYPWRTSSKKGFFIYLPNWKLCDILKKINTNTCPSSLDIFLERS